MSVRRGALPSHTVTAAAPPTTLGWVRRADAMSLHISIALPSKLVYVTAGVLPLKVDLPSRNTRSLGRSQSPAGRRRARSGSGAATAARCSR